MIKRVIATVLFGGSLASGASHAVDCSGLETWNNVEAYSGGAQVVFNNNAYQANWWTQNNNPETRSGPYQEWKLLGACDGGGGNQPPTANANGPYATQVGNAVNFSSAGSWDADGTIASYSWNFGDGNSSNSANPSHTYSTAGSYSVSLTVTDNGGAAGTASATVTVNGSGGGTGCDGLPTYSAGSPYAAGDRVVNFVQSSGQNVIFVCKIAGWCSSPGAWAYEPGNGAYWDHAWTQEGLCGGSNNQAPTADANGPYSGQVGAAIAFSSLGSDDPDGNIVSYSWSFGDGSSSNAANPTHSYTTAGTYNVSLTVTDDKNASASAATTATITGEGGNEAPIAEANGPYNSTVGTPISFSSAGSRDTDGNITRYAWDFGDGSSSSDANPTHSYTSTGNYTVTLTVTDNQGATAADTATANVSSTGPGGDKKVIGYFTQWGIYGRQYRVKNIVTSGSAEKLTHIMYAFGNVKNGRCVNDDDTFADYEKAFTAAESVDGVADTWDGSLRGNFNQLRKLKQMYPNIKVVWSFGGWTWSGGFGQAAANPTAFAESCYNLVHDPRWNGVFDGIDMDWEYPNECGLSCDSSGFEAFGRVMGALRARFGNDKLVTAAITASETKLDAANYGAAAQYVDFYMVMTYDFFGGWDRQGPTAPHSPLTNFSGIPIEGFYSDNAVQALKRKGVPANKILLGIGFYGRGWSGVTQSAPGGSATGIPMGAWEAGINDYKVLKGACPPTGTVAGTAYAHCGTNWWSYDTPATISGKMNYLKSQNLGGAFFWEFNGDTANGELINAISNGLK